ncbi:hypothetical protein WICMUC_005365 [Wickerhamomyces mucosus]|uniref:Guanine nucleotide-binding protein alpha-2 subunit n=1 Tax=Wickerhamomyces mucosus TaxID=1378264 RepID=A0A9P8P7K5_9ASCO|nr:hypothetical protein WICMUC_005365 [Wickerhamomyces mucosus]
MGICGSKEGHDEQAAGSAIVRKSNTLPNNKSQSVRDSQSGTISQEKSTSTNDVEQQNYQQLSSKQSQSNNSNMPSTKFGNSSSAHEYKKILLLGTGESGKSTIIQQLRILHSNGFTEEELYEFRPAIFNNIVTSAKDLVEAYKKFSLNLKPNDIINEDDFKDILELSPTSDLTAPFNPVLAKKLKALWDNESTDELIKKHRHEFYLMDSAKYFFNEIERISEPDYFPTLSDIVRTRKKTSGIFDFKFELQGLKIQIFDVGGQRSERKKWIHCFDNVASIIFCVSLSEYDQTLLEDETQNRLEESLTLFDSVVNSRWFQRCSIILFLNKIDVFIEKLPYSPLENFFPDYEGGSDANRAAKYILWKFTRVNRSGLPIYPYITQATDTNNIKLVFVVVRESIFSNLLQDTGLLS